LAWDSYKKPEQAPKPQVQSTADDSDDLPF